MAAVRMSTRLRNEILSQALTTFDNANPPSKYEEQINKQGVKLIKKLTPYILESAAWKVASEIRDVVKKHATWLVESNGYSSSNTILGKEQDNNIKIIEKYELDSEFENCYSSLKSIQISVDVDALPEDDADDVPIDFDDGSKTYAYSATPLRSTLMLNESREEPNNEYFFQLPWPMANKLGDAQIMQVSSYNYSYHPTLSLDIPLKQYAKIEERLNKFEAAKKAKISERKEYKDKINAILNPCTSVKQLLDFWPGAEKFLPQDVRQKLSEKTTRSNNRAEREAALAAIDTSNLNKTIIKASL